MPHYDYRCASCNHEFEIMQKMSDPIKKKCPECKKLKLNRLIGIGGGVIFKGDGFYCNDSKERARRMNGEGIVERTSVFSNKQIKKGPAKKQSE